MPSLPSAPSAPSVLPKNAITRVLCEAGETCGSPCRGLPGCSGQEIAHQQQPQLWELYGGVEGAGARGGHGNIALVIAPVYFSAAVNELIVFMMISSM